MSMKAQVFGSVPFPIYGTLLATVLAGVPVFAESLVLRPSTENSFINSYGDIAQIAQMLYARAYTGAYGSPTDQMGPTHVHFALDGIPDGARITEVRMHGIDNSVRVANLDLMVALPTQASPGSALNLSSANGWSSWTSGPVNVVVDHDALTYFLWLRIPELPGTETLGDLIIYSVVITYTP